MKKASELPPPVKTKVHTRTSRQDKIARSSIVVSIANTKSKLETTAPCQLHGLALFIDCSIC